MFLAQNVCELTFLLRQWVLLLIVVVGSAMPFSPGRAAGWPAKRRAWSPDGRWAVWRGRCANLGAEVFGRLVRSSLGGWQCGFWAKG